MMTTINDVQLREIGETLEALSIQYFVDSGSLLGLVRDGRLMPWDTDIDISIIDAQESTVVALLSRLHSAGYIVNPRKYQARTYGYTCYYNNYYQTLFYPHIPRSKLEGNRRLDIALLQRHEDVYWEPMFYRAGSDRGAVANATFRALCVPYFIAMKLLPRSLRSSPLIAALRHRVVRYGTRRIPVSLVDIPMRNAGIRMPKHTDAYLKYRYGDWMSPQPQWRFIRDDRSMSTLEPEQLDLLKAKAPSDEL